jgi:hypothetical protein
MRCYTSLKSEILFFLRYSSVNFEQDEKSFKEAILLRESDTISTFGSSLAMILKSSSSLPHRFTFLMEESLSVLHFERSRSLVRAFDEDYMRVFRPRVS